MTSKDRSKQYRQQIVNLYGKPIHHLYFTEDPIYFYPGFMVVNGVKVLFKDFIGATLNNSATPYFGKASQVIIETAIPDHKYIYAQVKSGDMDEARTVVLSIYRYVNEYNH
ncbi:MAG: hypothetical protein IJV05_06800 [Muribaculaceae bacterium]|nr:hypothetical protein [Muribaculaceae bacterium]